MIRTVCNMSPKPKRIPKPSHRPGTGGRRRRIEQTVWDPERLEQVGEYHKLKAHVMIGVATEKEKNILIILEYENSLLELKDLMDLHGKGVLSPELQLDTPILRQWLEHHLVEYRDALAKDTKKK